MDTSEMVSECDDTSDSETSWSLLKWYQSRKEKKKEKEYDALLKCALKAAYLTKVIETNKLAKVKALQMGTEFNLQRRLDLFYIQKEKLSEKMIQMKHFYQWKQACLANKIKSMNSENRRLQGEIDSLKAKVFKLGADLPTIKDSVKQTQERSSDRCQATGNRILRADEMNRK